MGGRTKKKPEVRWSQARHRPSRGGFELAYALEHPLMSDGVGGYISCDFAQDWRRGDRMTILHGLVRLVIYRCQGVRVKSFHSRGQMEVLDKGSHPRKRDS